MNEGFTALNTVSKFSQIVLRPNPNVPGYLDCPKPIRDAFFGRPPEPKLPDVKAFVRFTWPIYAGLLAAIGLLGFIAFSIWGAIAFIVLACLSFVIGIRQQVEEEHQSYARSKGLFDSFAANPNQYRDEIYKAAVSRLPDVDFYGRHLPVADAQVGRYEHDVLEQLRLLGVHQETTVECRGRPFAIHQYELKELGWVSAEDGTSRNYVLDIAILWPERHIKYDIEVDDPSHKFGARPYKDMNRDAVLTDRGWFVRRLNHNFLASGRAAEAVRDIVGIVYFFAKYANDEPLTADRRFGAWLQNRTRREAMAKEREAAAVPGV